MRYGFDLTMMEAFADKLAYGSLLAILLGRRILIGLKLAVTAIFHCLAMPDKLLALSRFFFQQKLVPSQADKHHTRKRKAWFFHEGKNEAIDDDVEH